jgi:excinuclease UvrABC nuclease subunit
VKTALYRYFDDDTLLYVGISNRLPQRVREHAGDAWWEKTTRIDVEWLPTREAARVAERQAVTSENPAFNVYLRSIPEPYVTAHEQVKAKLAKRGTNIGRFIEGGRMMRHPFRKIHADLVAMTGVDFAPATLRRWAEDFKETV